MSTKTRSFAESELDVLIKSSTDPENRPLVEEFIPEILALCEKFGLSGQSGGSAPHTAHALAETIKSLCLQEPICPITGIDKEWVDVADLDPGRDPLYQNWRCGALFKNENSDCWYLDAIVWKTQNDSSWCGSAVLGSTGIEIGSRQFVKEFPFTPKTFVIDVIEEEVEKDGWVFHIKDEKQLEAVFEYYKKPE